MFLASKRLLLVALFDSKQISINLFNQAYSTDVVWCSTMHKPHMMYIMSKRAHKTFALKLTDKAEIKNLFHFYW